MNFLNHVILNNPSRETISAGLGPIEQYSIILVALILIGIIAYFIKRKRRS
ncbi:MAG: LPXTG cell wall anchor domain-containing protein [Nanoarchaeota archaeon]|nr:LPXTG cell wall anchor domain-containing protein [Nanoarchaeota archaeon]